MDLSVFEHRVFSQNGEDGITTKLVELIYDGNYDDQRFAIQTPGGYCPTIPTRKVRQRSKRWA
jgi:hypothetical protein